MLTIYPDFYDEFSCRAGACQHSCCQGWEIDIDAATAQLYQELTSPISEEIRRHIYTNAEGSHFRLTADKRCPFLQPDGLCRLIRTMGEDSLCEICTMHPRFFVYLDDIELAGVGLCCEESVALLLEERPLSFWLWEDETVSDEPVDFPALLKLLELPVEIAELRAIPEQTIPYLKYILSLLEQTEPIDDSWSSLLADLRLWLENPQDLSLPSTEQLQKIYQYILYRQLERVDSAVPELLADFARLSTWFIVLTSTVTGNLPEAVRLWSAQIEYDTDNVDLLLELMAK